jgi:hypothetical protein
MNAPMAYVYDGRDVLGFILSRGKTGFEAFTRRAIARDVRDTARSGRRNLR